MTPLTKMFWEDLGEMLHSEEMLVKAMFRMNAAARGESLKAVLQTYRTESQSQSDKVRGLFERFGIPPREKKCDAVMAILMKAQQLTQRTAGGPLVDASILGLVRQVSSYNQIAYTQLHSWAKLIMADEPEALQMVEELVRTEKTAVQKFEKMMPGYNQAAAKMPEVVRDLTRGKAATPVPAAS